MAKKPGDGGPERAARLSEQIDRIVHPGSKTDDADAVEPAKGNAMSPHDFVQKRMRELDGKKDRKPD